jgi:LPS-assembly lipoprotein
MTPDRPDFVQGSRLALADRNVDPVRRRLLLAAAASALLGACGFQLRGAAHLPFSTLYVQGSGNTPLGQELRRALKAANVRLEDAPGKAEATLTIMSEIRDRLILSLGGQGRVREYQLRYRLAYQLTDAKSVVITAPTEILIKRDISFNDNEALAKESEEALLYRDMQSDAVQQLLRRLQATKMTPAVS